MFVARAIDGIAGGVERMVTSVMNALSARGYHVDFMTWDRAGATAFFPLSPEITWHKLDLGDPTNKASYGLKMKRAHAVRRLMERCRPDAIVCFQDGPFLALRVYTIGMGVPIFVAERNAPTRFEHTSAAKRQRLTYNAMRFAKRILIQCESYRKLYPPFLHDRIVTIPNPVFPVDARCRPATPDTKSRFRILSVGRLSYQKNPGVLVEAFAALAQSFPQWDLVLIGDGAQRAELENMIACKGLASRVFMPGTSRSVSDWYTGSHVFCLSSLWEGFPNAMAEAMAHGMPCVGFEGCAGVRDLIIHNENGLLAEGNGNVQNLAAALKILLDSAEMRESFGGKGVENVKSYAPDEIFSLWERTLTGSVRS